MAWSGVGRSGTVVVAYLAKYVYMSSSRDPAVVAFEEVFKHRAINDVSNRPAIKAFIPDASPQCKL